MLRGHTSINLNGKVGALDFLKFCNIFTFKLKLLVVV